MRNKIKTSGGNRKGPWLVIWARKLRNWLDTYLSENVVASPESGAMPPVALPEQEDSAVRSHPKEVSAAMEHWLELARKAAPELLSPEGSGDSQQGAGETSGQTKEEAKEIAPEEGVSQEPESNTASAASHRVSKSPSGHHQQPWSAAPRMDRATKKESAASRPILELRPSRQEEPDRTSRHVKEASKTEASRKEVRTSRMSQQREQISDAQYPRALCPPDIGEEPQTGSVKKQNKGTLVKKMTEAAPVASPRLRKTADKVWAFFTGRNRKETADRAPQIQAELDSAPPPISSPAVESRHASGKKLAPDKPPADPSARKLLRKEVGTPSAVLEWKGIAAKAATHEQPSRENAEPERHWRSLVTEDVRASKATTMHLNRESRRPSGPEDDPWPDRPETDRWPELPEDLSLSNPDWMESLRSREHIYALDAEQQRGS
jgi:hypothetical protein